MAAGIFLSGGVESARQVTRQGAPTDVSTDALFWVNLILEKSHKPPMRPRSGYLMLFEETPKSTSPVRVWQPRFALSWNSDEPE